MIWQSDRPLEHFKNKKGQAVFNAKFPGKQVGSLTDTGYLLTQLQGKNHKVHRTIFLLWHGYLPDIVDHRDGNILNNRIDNLRSATHQQNMSNCKVSKNNKLGIMGVSPVGNKFKAKIDFKGTTHQLGLFDTMEGAEGAYIGASKVLRGDFHKAA